MSKTKNKFSKNKVLKISFVGALILVISTILFLFYLRNSVEVVEPTPNVSIEDLYSEQNNVDPVNYPIKPGSSYQLSAIDLEVNCPLDSIGCKDFNDGEFTYFIIASNDRDLSLSLNYRRFNISDLNNPNYTTVSDWLDALAISDELSVGGNLDEAYGKISVDGTDGFIYPVYRGMDLDTVEQFQSSSNLITVVKNDMNYTTHFFIEVKDANEIYLLSFGKLLTSSNIDYVINRILQ